MYPLNMHHKTAVGFALANDEKEHKALSDAGYEPKLEAPVAPNGGEPADAVKRGPGRPRKADAE